MAEEEISAEELHARLSEPAVPSAPRQGPLGEIPRSTEADLIAESSIGSGEDDGEDADGENEANDSADLDNDLED